MIQTISRPGPGVGQDRFVVRGKIYLDETREGIVRPRINEYPERYAFEPFYPQPGRRGPSPVSAKQGATTIPATPATYPVPRPRDAIIGTTSDPSLALADPQFDTCYEMGGTFRSSPSVGAGATVGDVTRRIPRPFVITHISYWSENTLPTGAAQMNVRFFISDDNDVSAGNSTSGYELDLVNGQGVVTPHNVREDHYPMFVIREPSQFIKIIYLNNSAGALETYVIVDWKYLS